MTAALEKIFEQYGFAIRAERGGEELYTEKAFVQPVRDAEKEFPFTVTGLGCVDDRHWLCLTRSALREGDRVWVQNVCYEAVNCTAYSMAGQEIYWRTILRSEREEAL